MQARTKRIWGALLLGPLAVLPTLVLYFVTKPLLFIVAVVSALGGSRWLFNMCLSLIAIAGSAIVAFVSFRIFRSRGLAALTLATALVTQAVAVTIWDQGVKRAAVIDLAERRSLEAELDRTVQRYATVGATRFEVSEPLDRPRDNFHPELGPIYGRLIFRVPVTVREAGIYRLQLRYQTRPDSVEFDTGRLQSVDTLTVGEHELSVQFAMWGWDRPGLWSPASIGGRATAELYMKVNQAKLIRSYLEGTKPLGRARLEQVKRMESVTNVTPWREMWIDSAVTEFPGGVRHPKDSRWAPAPKSSRLTDKQEEELRRRKTNP